MSQRRYEIPLTDLIDAVTIAQIKETLFELPMVDRATAELDSLSRDIDAVLKERGVLCSADAITLIALLGTTNLLVWLNKDRMQEEPAHYSELLEHAQELNGIRNHTRNIMMRLFGEHAEGIERATFLDASGSRWYSSILKDLDLG